MSQTFWLLVVLAVVRFGIADDQFFPKGHGLIDGSYVKIREEIVKDFRLLAGGGDHQNDVSSALSLSLPALPTLPAFPTGQPLAGIGFPGFKPFPSVPEPSKKDECSDCSDDNKH